jgi:hypothetical protein
MAGFCEHVNDSTASLKQKYFYQLNYYQGFQEKKNLHILVTINYRCLYIYIYNLCLYLTKLYQMCFYIALKENKSLYIRSLMAVAYFKIFPKFSV